MESVFEAQLLHRQPPRAPAPAFRAPCPPPALSLEERALVMARSHLLRSSLPPPPPPRPLALPLPGLWSQWVQLQHLHSQLALAQAPPPPRPATPPSRSPSPLQVDT